MSFEQIEFTAEQPGERLDKIITAHIGDRLSRAQVQTLIEDGMAETPDAQALRKKLVQHFAPNHPVILDCDRLRRFQAFKLRRARPEGA